MSKSYGAVAASVAANKAKHPDKYCASPKCLWRLTSGPCPKHPVKERELSYDEVSHGSGDYDAFNMPLESRKPEKGSDEWYEMMDNPKSAWRAGE